jgi:hypothetical protein
MLNFLGFCTGYREGLQFKNKQKHLASAAEAAQTEGEQSISSFNVYDVHPLKAMYETGTKPVKPLL